MTQKPSFTPPWCETVAPPGSRRSLFKYGDPAGFKHPGSGLYAFIKETFGMTDADFQSPNLCMDPLPTEIPSRLSRAHLEALTAIVGEENIRLDTVSRVKASYGAGQVDALRLRQGIMENLPEAVLAPRGKDDVEAIVNYCNDHRIPLYVYGGGSTVTRGMEAVKGGICLDLSTHMRRVLSFNETDQTITVEPGIWGPELEDILNRAPETLSASRAYTCGHFPQSFEHSSVGGWVVTRGAGQNSTYYGKIEDILYSLEMVYPGGVIRTPNYPRSATGPDMRQILAGSEGTFGVVTCSHPAGLPPHAPDHPALRLALPLLGGCPGNLPRGDAIGIRLSLRLSPFGSRGDRCGHAHVPHPRHPGRFSPARPRV